MINIFQHYICRNPEKYGGDKTEKTTRTLNESKRTVPLTQSDPLDMRRFMMYLIFRSLSNNKNIEMRRGGGPF